MGEWKRLSTQRKRKKSKRTSEVGGPVEVILVKRKEAGKETKRGLKIKGSRP